MFDSQKDAAYILNMKIGYGYRRDEADLKAAGAEKVYVDISRERQERADMVAYGLREGDTLLLLSMRDLGGAPKADAMWRERVEAMGVAIEVVALPDDKPPAKIGRPKKYEPTPEQEAQIRKIWLCWHYTEAYKLRRAAEIYGHPVGRGVLFNRYGSMKKPKERD
jgi:hypothetical protein